MPTFNESLKRIRLERNMSQEEFARLLGTSKQVISRYETGQRIPKLSIAKEYAEKLGVSLSILTGEDSTPPEAPVRAATMEELKFALFGGDADRITDAQFEEVRQFARFVAAKEEQKRQK